MSYFLDGYEKHTSWIWVTFHPICPVEPYNGVMGMSIRMLLLVVLWLQHQHDFTSCSVLPAVQCSGGQLYQECGRACGGSCTDSRSCNEAADDSGLRTCVPGCQCPAGLVQDPQGQCVPVSMCPCVQGDKTYQPGAVIQNSCNTWWVEGQNRATLNQTLTGSCKHSILTQGGQTH